MDDVDGGGVDGDVGVEVLYGVFGSCVDGGCGVGGGLVCGGLVGVE